jgi:hypothetical protein
MALERDVDGSGLRRDGRWQEQKRDQESEATAAHEGYLDEVKNVGAARHP